LLATPLKPGELALGKWIAVALFNGGIVVLTLAGFYLTLRYAPLPPIGVPFLFGTEELARFVVVLLPLAAMLPALMLYLGMRARTVKEAQTNVQAVTLVFAFLPMIQQFLQHKEPEWLLWVPMSGQYTLLGRVLRGDAFVWTDWLQTAAVPVVVTAIALNAVARLVSRESVLASR